MASKPFRVSVHSLEDGRVKSIPCDSLEKAVGVCNRSLAYMSASVVNVEKLNDFSGRYETLVSTDSGLDPQSVLALYRPIRGRTLTQVVFDV